MSECMNERMNEWSMKWIRAVDIANLDYLAFGDNSNAVSIFDRAQSMGYHKNRST